MQVLKKVNNNVVVCRDNNGRELIAFGKGLGFHATPYTLDDLSKIERTFYDISPEYMETFQTIPVEIIEFTSAVVDLARAKLHYQLSPNLLLTLSDHIAFAIQRARKGIHVRMPLAYDLEQLYPTEIEIARKTLDAIKKQYRVSLPKDEASGIAMAFINARIYSENEKEIVKARNDQKILDEITGIIENFLEVKIDTTSFNYTRYATHVQYLLDRLYSGKGIDSLNHTVYTSIREECPKTAQCVDLIARHLKKKYQLEVTEEEQLYLILHVNRVYTNEGL